MVVEALVVGSPESLDACLADAVTAAFVFVVRCAVADALMKRDAVVVVADTGELGVSSTNVTFSAPAAAAAAITLRCNGENCSGHFV